MYNPQNVHECEKEKRRNPRKVIDSMMTFVGIVASVSSVPQILKIVETQNVSGISVATYIIAWIAVVSWFFYGIYIKNRPLTITSGISTLILGAVIILIFLYS